MPRSSSTTSMSEILRPVERVCAPRSCVQGHAVRACFKRRCNLSSTSWRQVSDFQSLVFLGWYPHFARNICFCLSTKKCNLGSSSVSQELTSADHECGQFSQVCPVTACPWPCVWPMISIPHSGHPNFGEAFLREVLLQAIFCLLTWLHRPSVSTV